MPLVPSVHNLFSTLYIPFPSVSSWPELPFLTSVWRCEQQVPEYVLYLLPMSICLHLHSHLSAYHVMFHALYACTASTDHFVALFCMSVFSLVCLSCLYRPSNSLREFLTIRRERLLMIFSECCCTLGRHSEARAEPIRVNGVLWSSTVDADFALYIMRKHFVFTFLDRMNNPHKQHSSYIFVYIHLRLSFRRCTFFVQMTSSLVVPTTQNALG